VVKAELFNVGLERGEKLMSRTLAETMRERGEGRMGGDIF